MAYTQVFDLYGGFLLGYLGDLHLHGAMVIGEKIMAENTELTISVELPDLPNIKAMRMTVPVRVVWCQQDLSPQFFNIGSGRADRSAAATACDEPGALMHGANR